MENRFCSYCGSELQQGAQFCVKCGNKINISGENTEQANNNVQGYYQTQQNVPPNMYAPRPVVVPKKKSGVGKVIAICAIVLVVLVIFFPKGKSDTNSSSKTQEVKQSAQEHQIPEDQKIEDKEIIGSSAEETQPDIVEESNEVELSDEQVEPEEATDDATDIDKLTDEYAYITLRDYQDYSSDLIGTKVLVVGKATDVDKDKSEIAISVPNTLDNM